MYYKNLSSSFIEESRPQEKNNGIANLSSWDDFCLKLLMGGIIWLLLLEGAKARAAALSCAWIYARPYMFAEKFFLLLLFVFFSSCFSSPLKNVQQKEHLVCLAHLFALLKEISLFSKASQGIQQLFKQNSPSTLREGQRIRFILLEWIHMA